MRAEMISAMEVAVSDGMAVGTLSYKKSYRYNSDSVSHRSCSICSQMLLAIDAAVSDGVAADISSCTVPYISTCTDSLDWEQTLSVMEATSSSD